MVVDHCSYNGKWSRKFNRMGSKRGVAIAETSAVANTISEILAKKSVSKTYDVERSIMIWYKYSITQVLWKISWSAQLRTCSSSLLRAVFLKLVEYDK